MKQCENNMKEETTRLMDLRKWISLLGLLKSKILPPHMSGIVWLAKYLHCGLDTCGIE